MRTDKIQKISHSKHPLSVHPVGVPKLGTAYRLAAGNGFAHKLIGLGQTIGPAFADFAPGVPRWIGLLVLWAQLVSGC